MADVVKKDIKIHFSDQIRSVQGSICGIKLVPGHVFLTLIVYIPYYCRYQRNT